MVPEYVKLHLSYMYNPTQVKVIETNLIDGTTANIYLTSTGNDWNFI
jgi:hypothetical protein